MNYKKTHFYDTKRSFISLLTLTFLFFFVSNAFAGGGSCTPGEIIDGSSTVLDPNGNGFMSSSPSTEAWTVSSSEFAEFEELIPGPGGANVGWTALQGTEPTGLQESGDLSAGGNCGNTDITADSDGGADYSYYSIVDPDQIADNGDEYLAIAIRIADKITGAFTFSFLIDADNNCGADLDATCGNPCFEYEVQLNTQSNEVILIAIDGCAGTSDCDTRNGAGTPNGTDAYICNPCNTEAIQVCAGSTECTSSGLEPVFWMFYIDFDDMPSLNSTSIFNMVPATTTSPNSVIYKNTNVSDYGGIGDPDNVNECDCVTACLGSSCADCEADCALTCAAEVNTFPVELLGFAGEFRQGIVNLTWATASELNNSHFVIERARDGKIFEQLGQVSGAGNSDHIIQYKFSDFQPYDGVTYYRLKQVDFDGAFKHSSILTVTADPYHLTMNIHSRPNSGIIDIFINSDQNISGTLEILSASGQLIYSEYRELISGSQNLSIPSKSLGNGVYFVRLNDHTRHEIHHGKFLSLN